MEKLISSLHCSQSNSIKLIDWHVGFLQPTNFNYSSSRKFTYLRISKTKHASVNLWVGISINMVLLSSHYQNAQICSVKQNAGHYAIRVTDILQRYRIITLSSDGITAYRLSRRKGRVQINSDWIQFRTENVIHTCPNYFCKETYSKLCQGG